MTDENKAKLILRNKLPVSLETRTKQSLSQSGKIKNEETRKRMSEAKKLIKTKK